MKQKIAISLLALTLCISTVVPVWAASGSTDRSVCGNQWYNFTPQKRGGSYNTKEAVRAIQVIMSGIDTHLYEEVMNCGGFDGSFGPGIESAVRNCQITIFKNDPSQWDGKVGPNTWRQFYRSISGPVSGVYSGYYSYQPSYKTGISSYHIRQRVSNASWSVNVPSQGWTTFEWP